MEKKIEWQVGQHPWNGFDYLQIPEPLKSKNLAYIYVLAEKKGMKNVFKVGMCASVLYARISALSSGNPRPLELVAFAGFERKYKANYRPPLRRLEADMHKSFEAVHGEWVRAKSLDDILAKLELNAINHGESFLLGVISSKKKGGE